MNSSSRALSFLVISLNHSGLPLADREHLAVAARDAKGVVEHVLDALADHPPEALLLSTCNRLELYCSLRDEGLVSAVMTRFTRLFGIDGREWTEQPRVFVGAAAIRHVFRVASGLESLVLGESEIVGQLKEAVRSARAAGTLNGELEPLFQRALSASRVIRRETKVGLHSVSIPSAAVRLATGALPRLEGSRMLFVGAGAMGGLAVARFAGLRPRELVVASRSAERAMRLAKRYGARAIRICDLPDEAGTFDLIVCSTPAPVPAIHQHLARRSAAAAPTVVIDLSVPRSVDPGAAGLPRVRLFTLDDITALVSAGFAARRAASAAAEPIIAREAASFLKWLESRRAVPALLQLDAWAERLRAAELERVRRELKNGVPLDTALSQFAARLSNKLLHPSRRLLAFDAVAGDGKRHAAKPLFRSAQSGAAQRRIPLHGASLAEEQR